MKAKKKLFQVLALCLAISLSMGMIVVAAVGSGAASNDTLTKQALEQTYGKYQKIDINSITGEGGNPPEISGAASASAAEKAWYEYITYSSQAVASIRVDDDRRLLFYDPFDYSNAMIMDVTGEENEWSSANSLEISYSSGKTISEGSSSSIDTSTSIEQQEGKDENYSYSKGTSKSTTESWSKTKSKGQSFDFTSGMSGGLEGGGLGVTFSTELSFSTTQSNSSSVDDTQGREEVTGSDTSETSGWATVANRVTKATGSSSSTNTSWSTEESKTVTQVYNAAYFNDAGSPLQWKVVRYTVYMPMKYELQCKIDGEWVTTDYAYCMLTTMQGTCRAYMNNTQAYIEHWGTGEAVLWDDFWDGFFTEESLLAAYKNKLYPDN